MHSGEIEGEAAHAAEEQTIAPRTRKKKPRNPSPGRHPLPAHLPRVEEIITCAPEQCRCGQCGRDGPRNFLHGFRGRLQCDGYAGDNEFDDEAIQRIACLAHIRRKFCDAQKVAPEDPRPLSILGPIKDLYRIEKQAREQGLDAEARRQLRQARSAPIMAQLKERILQERQAVLPASAMGKACDYARGQWNRMERYLEHGEVEIDNNHCENGIRPVALGRKNWLHIGSEEAGAKIAPILSRLETCRRLGIKAREYLLDVLPGLSERDQSEVPALTPTQWLKRRQPARPNTSK